MVHLLPEIASILHPDFIFEVPEAYGASGNRCRGLDTIVSDTIMFLAICHQSDNTEKLNLPICLQILDQEMRNPLPADLRSRTYLMEGWIKK
jgi:hypothetical protein